MKIILSIIDHIILLSGKVSKQHISLTEVVQRGDTSICHVFVKQRPHR